MENIVLPNGLTIKGLTQFIALHDDNNGDANVNLINDNISRQSLNEQSYEITKEDIERGYPIPKTGKMDLYIFSISKVLRIQYNTYVRETKCIETRYIQDITISDAYSDDDHIFINITTTIINRYLAGKHIFVVDVDVKDYVKLFKVVEALGELLPDVRAFINLKNTPISDITFNNIYPVISNTTMDVNNGVINVSSTEENIELRQEQSKMNIIRWIRKILRRLYNAIGLIR